MENKENITEEIEELDVRSGVSHNYNYVYSDMFDIEDIDDRRFYLYTSIERDELEGRSEVDTIIYHIMRCNRMDDEANIKVKDRLPIKIYISSPGGSVSLGMSLIDAIQLSKTPVYTINVGMAYSMAYLILLAGHKRFALPHSTFLLHDGQNFVWDSGAKLADKVNFDTNQTEKRIREYVLSRTKISEETYDQKYRVEWYSYPEEAKENGVIDYIVGTDCKFGSIL